MRTMVAESWMLLLRFELPMCRGALKILRSMVQKQQVLPATTGSIVTSDQLSRAMDYACVFYFKRVHCLQRSAATTVLLRRHGWDAEMVTGVQILPYKAHAWVEIHDQVVNDRPYMRTIYQVLDRY